MSTPQEYLDSLHGQLLDLLQKTFPWASPIECAVDKPDHRWVVHGEPLGIKLMTKYASTEDVLTIRTFISVRRGVVFAYNLVIQVRSPRRTGWRTIGSPYVATLNINGSVKFTTWRRLAVEVVRACTRPVYDDTMENRGLRKRLQAKKER